jgi:hypothetical protein
LRKSITSIMLDLLVLSRESGIWPQRDVIKYIRSAIALDGLIKTFSPGMDIGRHLELACERNLKWDSVRNLTSPDTLAGWVGGYTNLVRDGALRAVALLRRLGTEEPSANQIVTGKVRRTHKGRRWSQALQLLWVAAFMIAILKPGQILAGHSFLTAPVTLMSVLCLIWLVFKQEPVG